MVELPLTGGVRVAARTPSVSVMEAEKWGVVVRNGVKTGLPQRAALRYPPAMDAAGRRWLLGRSCDHEVARWRRGGVVVDSVAPPQVASRAPTTTEWSEPKRG